MALPFGATFKEMLGRSPADWLALASLAAPGAELTDADVSTVTAAADKVLRVPGPPPWVAQVEAQSGPDAAKPRLMLLYNAALEARHELPVASVLVLLAPRANLRVYDGEYRSALPGEEPHLVFRYRVVRVWELPVEPLLAGGLGTLPLAPIGAVREGDLPGLVERMDRRLLGERDEERRRVWTSAFVLMGLRYEKRLILQLTERLVRTMEESVTYQWIIEQGAAREARKTLLMQGEHRFGPPPEGVRAAVEGIADLDRLERLSLRLLDVGSWADLLAEPAAPAPTRRRRRPS